ncbi:hypothetical protein SprV_0902736600 [Sparganum proliferum]
MANTKHAREFLEAWHSNTTSINRHVDLDAHYEELVPVIFTAIGISLAGFCCCGAIALFRSRISPLKVYTGALLLLIIGEVFLVSYFFSDRQRKTKRPL